MKHLRKFLSLFMLVALVAAVFVSPAYAFDGRTGQDVTIGKGEVINDDLYVSAETFTLDGTVKGDVYAVGSIITINGTVEGDLVAAGQAVIINGKVMDDARIAGAALRVSKGAEVGGDVVAAGASLEVQAGSTIGGDVVVGSAQVLLAGDVGRNVLAGTSAFELDGSVGGDVKAYVDATEDSVDVPVNMTMTNVPISIPRVKTGLTISKDSSIQGDLDYTSTIDLPIPSSVVSGKITRTAPPVEVSMAAHEPTAAEKLGTWGLGMLRAMITLILFSLVLGWLFPRFMKALPAALRTQPWPSLGWGMIAWAAFFFAILCLILFMVLGGIVFGILTLGGVSGTIVWVGLLSLFGLTVGFVLVTSYLTKIVVGENIGRWILARINPTAAEHKYWPSILGIVILVLGIGLLNFPLLPIGAFGGLVNFVVILFGLGALWIWGREAMKPRTA